MLSQLSYLDSQLVGAWLGIDGVLLPRRYRHHLRRPLQTASQQQLDCSLDDTFSQLIITTRGTKQVKDSFEL